MNRINSTRFMAQEELMEQLTPLDLENGRDCGAAGIPLLVKGGKAYVDTTDSHTIIFGATGSKKTRLLGMPGVELLSRAGESFVVTDPKGEIFSKTAAVVSNRGYQLICLNLRDLKRGETWNPLSLPYDYYHQGEKGKAVEMLSEIAKMLAGNKAEDPFWSNSTADVITGLMLILLESAEKNECQIKSVISLWEQYMAGKEYFIKNIKEIYPKTMISRKLSCLDNESNRTVGSIESLVATALNRISANEEFVDFLSQDGFKFESITEKKSAIYLIVPDENQFYHFIASLFMEQLYEALIKEAQKNKSCKLDIRMNYIIDEFANIPVMQNMDSMITAGRSRNIRFNLIVQSKKQLEDKYGAVASVICDNCNNWIYLYSKDFGLLSEISKLCGEVIYDNHMRLPLISEFDLQHLKKEDGEALVLAGRNYPCITNLMDVDDYLQMNQINEIILEKKEWCKPCVYTMIRECSKDKFAYTPKYVPWDKVSTCTSSEEYWLVGTINGMIILNSIVNKQEMQTPKGIVRVCMNQLKDLRRIDEMEWYIANADVQINYISALNRNRRRVFVMLDDLIRERFIRVDDKITQTLKEVAKW